ncbi:MAG: hypothetical protein QME64_11585, partial [bacterium]|nr:hypothetical protein [bacterium]
RFSSPFFSSPKPYLKNLKSEISPWGVYIFFNQGRILRNKVNFDNELLSAITTKSYPEFMQINWESKVPQDLANRISISLFGVSAYTGYITTVSLLRLAQIQAAIQLYHLEKKQLPKSLDELKPYFQSIPLDPFNDKPFLWSQDSKGKPFAYSVGPDFVDDAAKTIYDPTNGTTSQGDIMP